MRWFGRRQGRREKLLEELASRLEADFLGVDAWAKGAGRRLPQAVLEAAKTAFARRWFETEVVSRFPQALMPDDEQLACIADTSHNVQVVARAGSGKTATVVNRALFLLGHGGVSPSQMLVLAFNRKAVAEVKARLSGFLSPPLPHVMTFHALAHRLVKPEEEMLFDDVPSEVTRQSRVVRFLIEQYLESPEWSDLVSSLVQCHFADTLVGRVEDGRVHARRALDWSKVFGGQWELGKWEVDRLSGAMRAFVSRCRKRVLSADDLRQAVAGHVAGSEAEAMFLEMAEGLYQSYLDWLSHHGAEDFDGLVERAVEAIHRGQTQFRSTEGAGDLRSLRFVFVDEFQDFSELFYRLLGALRTVSPQAGLFCVGDDWQAINGFAGSERRFFADFGACLGPFSRRVLPGNYRSVRAVVDVSNRLMTERVGGEPGIPHREDEGEVYEADLLSYPLTPVEHKRFRGSALKAVCVRLAALGVQAGRRVVFLSRTNRMPGLAAGGSEELGSWLADVRRFLPRETHAQVEASTVHQFKGLERQMVVLADAFDDRYPLVHQDWVFGRVHGDSVASITDDERRLFYVALTRASEVLVIVSESGRQSPFLLDLKASGAVLRPLDWDELPMPVRDGDGVFVQVGNPAGSGVPTWRIKDSLKASGYVFRSGARPFWENAYRIEGFSLEVFEREGWPAEADGVEVSLVDDVGDVVERFLVHGGRWQAVA